MTVIPANGRVSAYFSSRRQMYPCELPLDIPIVEMLAGVLSALLLRVMDVTYRDTKSQRQFLYRDRRL